MLTDRLVTPAGVGWLRRAATVLLVLGLVACAEEAGSGPADPTLLPPGQTQGPVTTAASGAVTTRTLLPGFEEVALEVTTADGEVLSWCLLLAATDQTRARGLMEVTDPELGGYDGMLFRFDAPGTGGFYMRNTPQPLSIGFIDEAGGLVSAHVMEPCANVDGCPTTFPSGPYTRAIEVPVAAGGIQGLGIDVGARTADLARPCASDGS